MKSHFKVVRLIGTITHEQRNPDMQLVTSTVLLTEELAADIGPGSVPQSEKKNRPAPGQPGDPPAKIGE